MGTVTVVGRDELGRIIDVSLTTEADVAPPGPEIVAVSGDASVTTVLSRTVTLTDAQIKALYTGINHIELVPAPGAGKALLFVKAFVLLDATAGAYTNRDNDSYISIDQSGNDVSAGIKLPPASASSRWAILGDRIFEVEFMESYPIEDADDVSLRLQGANIGGALTGGNAANTLTVTVLYTVVDL